MATSLASLSPTVTIGDDVTSSLTPAVVADTLRTKPLVIYEVGSSDFSVTLTKTQYDWTRTLLIILFVVIIIITIIMIIWSIVGFVNRVPPGPPPGPKPSPVPIVDQDPGASLAGVANFHNGEELTDAAMCMPPHGIWDEGASQCNCIQPFFGRRCGREAHNDAYYGLGEVTEPGGLTYDKVPVPPPNSITGMRLSFRLNGGADLQSCTGLCDQREDCFGVEYDGTNCALITSNPELGPTAEITVNPDVEPDVYLYRSGVRPVVRNRVFGYSGKRPLRFWAHRPPNPLDKSSIVLQTLGEPIASAAPAGVAPAAEPAFVESNGIPGGADVLTFWQGQVTQIYRPPQRVVNDGAMVGVWSIRSFTPADFPRLAQGGMSGVYVDRGGRGSDYQLPLPGTMRGKSMFVMYDRLLTGPTNPPAFFN